MVTLKKVEKILILDSTVFLEGYARLFTDKQIVTTNHVLEEVRSGKAQIELDLLLKSGLAIKDPKHESVEEVLARREKTQDKMSRADISIVALALEFKSAGKPIVVVSDDYAVQNLCRSFGIEFLSVSKPGITKEFIWLRRCTGCGRFTDKENCPVCGSPTRFVPTEK